MTVNRKHRNPGSEAPTQAPRPRRNRTGRLLLLLAGLLACVAPAEAGLKIYYLRHAEGGHNVVKEWSKVPKSQWPAYVGNGNIFTPLGEKQAAAATAKLQKYHFDAILVSSMWRTRNTVLPYLKTTGAKGEIWPELHEFTGGTLILATNLPATSGPILDAGPPIELPTAEAPYFRLRQDAPTTSNSPPSSPAPKKPSNRKPPSRSSSGAPRS
jgi:hypothetical protein